MMLSFFVQFVRFLRSSLTNLQSTFKSIEERLTVASEDRDDIKQRILVVKKDIDEDLKNAFSAIKSMKEKVFKQKY